MTDLRGMVQKGNRCALPMTSKIQHGSEFELCILLTAICAAISDPARAIQAVVRRDNSVGTPSGRMQT